MGRYLNEFGNKILTIVGVVAAVALVLLIGNNVVEEKENARLELENEAVYTTTTTDVTTTTIYSTEGLKVIDIPVEYNYISYSAINGIARVINTAALYTWCGEKDFTSIKGDVQITKDGKLIMCHDEGFTLNEKGEVTLYDKENAIAIRSMSEAECLELRHQSNNSNICSFEEYVSICKKYNKIAYITIRDKYIDEVIPELLRILHRQEMMGKCIINSFTYTSLQKVRKLAPNIMLSYVLPYKAKVTTDDIDDAVALGNCLVCGFNFGASSTVNDVEAVVDMQVVNYAKDKGVPIYEAQVHSMEIANKLKEYGISGVQMMIAPTKG